MKNENVISIGGILVVLRIIMGTDRVIGYSFIGAGVLVTGLQWIQSRNRGDTS